MSYTPTEWESTDVVTATRMNALEQAVGDMNMSYTPNTWSDGDILSAEKMNALEQAVASGGGGSSDFSTAEVTLINNTIDKYDVDIELPCIVFEELLTGAGFGDPDNELVIEALSYKNTPAYATIDTGSGVVATTIGDIRIISSSGGGYTFEITGDGTITIS